VAEFNWAKPVTVAKARWAASRADKSVRLAVALLAFAGVLCTQPNAAKANTGEELYASCAQGVDSGPKATCYAYIQGIVDDSKLIDGDVDARIIREIGRFCLRPEVTRDQIYDAVMRELRASPRSRKYTAALHVRFALVQAFPCPPMRPPRGKPPH
jgi:hypothetical protein